MSPIRRARGGSVAFDEACEAVRRLLGDVVRDEVRTRYKVGLILRRVQGETSTYGEGAIERMSELLGVSSHVLYQCTRVAGNWSDGEMLEITGLESVRGEPLSWSHLVALTKAPSDDARRALTKRWAAGSWSVRDLREAMASDRAREAYEFEEPSAGGEPVRVALRDGLQHASRAAVQFEVILDALQTRLAEEAGGPDEDLRARVIQAYERLGGKVEETLECLRTTHAPSEVRVRVAARAPEKDEMLLEEEELEVRLRQSRAR